MTLNSLSFIKVFIPLLAILLLLHFIDKKLHKNNRIQLLSLLAFSYYFLSSTDWRFCYCLVGVTVFTYYIGISVRNNKALCFFGTACLVLVLGYFKYTNFFVSSFLYIIGEDAITLNIIIPVGISFYIFSALSYLFDIYYGKQKAEKNFLNFALYISFFPKLTAGPIVRGKDFFPQVHNYRGITKEAFLAGIQIYVFGLFKKIVLADRLGVFVDDVFHAPIAFNTGTTILAAISYSLQIYFDFSGYSDMAIGISKILGFDFIPNFNLPYIAQNVSEFWKRWHISLSSWFQDYLYIPLGGSRKGTTRTYFNLFLVMLVSGLWHGAGWTFIAWGALHGIASCIYKAVGKQHDKAGKVVNGVLTFIVVTLFWVFFRADSFDNALQVLRGMFTIHTGISQPYTWSFFAIACLIGATVAAVIHSRKVGEVDRNGNPTVNGHYPILDLSKFWSLVAFFTFCGLTIILGYFGNTAFIYGAF